MNLFESELPLTSLISFEVFGDPIGQPRERVGVLNGHARTYMPKTLKRADGTRRDNPIFAWKRAIELAATPYCPRCPLDGALRVDLRFRFARPNSHYNSKGERRDSAPVFHTSRPDRDNLDKAVLDVLTNLHFWNDDSQVVDGRIQKVYFVGPPGVEINISKATM